MDKDAMDSGSSVGAEMPRYKSHKEVRALKIAQVESDVDMALRDGARETTGGVWLTPEDRRYARFHVGGGYLEKHKPQPGGYYVVYPDGYKSFSPAAAFEGGYTLVS